MFSSFYVLVCMCANLFFRTWKGHKCRSGLVSLRPFHVVKVWQQLSLIILRYHHLHFMFPKSKNESTSQCTHRYETHHTPKHKLHRWKYGTIVMVLYVFWLLNMLLLAFACEAQVRLLIITVSQLWQQLHFTADLLAALCLKTGTEIDLCTSLMCYPQTEVTER